MQTANHNLSPKEIKEYPLRFTASGSEYMRIWVFNLLLIIITLGIYYPWAKARRIRYFCNNTELKGHCLDFHGEPHKMLKGNILAGLLLLLCSKAMDLSGLAPLVAVLALVVLAPPLFRASMQFRLANTSWRGIRFHFAGDVAGAYLSVGVIFALALLPFGGKELLVMMSAPGANIGGLAGTVPLLMLGIVLAGVVLVAGFPYLLWRVKRYQHANYIYGALHMQFRCSPKAFYKVALKAVGLSVLGLLVLPILVWAGFGMMVGSMPKLMLVVAPLAYLSYYAFARSYWRVAMQNLAWSRTGNSQMRFVSRLAFGEYTLLQLRNYLFILCTLGLYWPFAVVASRRMEIEALELRVRGGSLETLASKAAKVADDAAVGDAAADLFGLDVGL